MSVTGPSALQRRIGEAHQIYVRGDVETALTKARAIVAEAGQDAQAQRLLGVILRAKGDAAGALGAFDAALRLAPDAAPILIGRGEALLDLGRDEEALETFDRARALGFAHPALDAGRGAALFRLGRFEDAHGAFAQITRAHPNDANGWFNQGRCLQELGRISSALAAYEQARRLAPQDAGIARNLAVALSWLGRASEAERAFDAALTLEPDHLETLYSKGVALLSAHALARGWPLHEVRRRASVRAAMRDDGRGEPEWRGEALAGPLRIWPEQGIGEEVLFARFAVQTRQRTGRVRLECAPRLAPLFARAFAQIEVCAGQERGPAAAQTPAGSLAHILGVNEVSGAAYLAPDAARAEALRRRYQEMARGRSIIGLAWASRVEGLGPHKSAPLSAWGSLLARDALFVNLQYGDSAADIAQARAAFGCEIISDAGVDQMRDLDGFAAQIAACDLVVSVSNTSVHLAGALGVRTLLLAPPGIGLFWYWGASGTRTPWYDSVEIVRRADGEGWAEQVARAAALI